MSTKLATSREREREINPLAQLLAQEKTSQINGTKQSPRLGKVLLVYDKVSIAN